MCTGMALGTGSALAHRAVDAVLGSRHPEPAQATAAAEELVRDNAPCSEQVRAYGVLAGGWQQWPCSGCWAEREDVPLVKIAAGVQQLWGRGLPACVCIESTAQMQGMGCLGDPGQRGELFEAQQHFVILSKVCMPYDCLAMNQLVRQCIPPLSTFLMTFPPPCCSPTTGQGFCGLHELQQRGDGPVPGVL